MARKSCKVKLTVVSDRGKEAVVGLPKAGSFFGEGCLNGHMRRLNRAEAITQEMLADMIGTTRSRVSFFMNKFRKLGFIEYNDSLEVHNSLLSVVLRD